MAVYDRATKAVLPEEQNEVSKQGLKSTKGIAFNEDRQFFTASVIRTTSFKFNIDNINPLNLFKKVIQLFTSNLLKALSTKIVGSEFVYE